MRKNSHTIVTKIIAIILIHLIISPASAGDVEALNYYKKGEDYLIKQKYEEALIWYKKALEEKSDDGTITIREAVIDKVPYGRSFKKVTSYNNRYEDYYPNRRIAEVLRKIEPSDLVLSVRFAEQDSTRQNKSIDPEEESILIVSVTNKGKGTGFGVKLNVVNDNRYVDHKKTFDLGDIQSGDSKETRIPLTAGTNLTAGVANFKIKCEEERGYDCKDSSLLIPTAALDAPDLIVNFQRFNDGRHKRGVGNGDGRLDAGEKGELIVLIENKGKGAAYGVVPLAISKGEGVFPGTPDPLVIEIINPGDKKEIRIPVEGGLDLAGGEEKVLIEAREKRGFDARKVNVSLDTVKLARPAFSIKSVRIFDGTSGMAKGNGNSVIENGETVELQVFVENTGVGEAFGVKLSLLDLSPEGIEIVQGESNLGQISVKETAKGKILIRVPRMILLKNIDAKFRIEEVDRKAAIKEQTLALAGGTLKPELAVKAEWHDDTNGLARGNGNGIWETGEIIEGVFTVTNRGTLTAEGVELRLRLKDKDIQIAPWKFTVGQLEPNQTSLPFRTTVTIPRTYDEQMTDIETVIAQQDFQERNETIVRNIVSLKPVLVVTQRILAGQPSGDKDIIGTVVQGERTKLEVRIRNEGAMDSQNVNVRVISKRTEVQLTGDSFFPLGTIPAGRSSDPLTVPLLVARSMPVGRAEIVVEVLQDEFNEVRQAGVFIVQEEGVEVVKAAGSTVRPVSPSVHYMPPTNPVVIVSPLPQGEVVQEFYELAYDLRGEVLSMEVRVNGELVQDQRGRGIGLTARHEESSPKRLRERIPLKPGTNNIEVIAYDLSNQKWMDKIEITRIRERGEIWAVVMGVSRYQNNLVRSLMYARRDAESFVEYLTDVMDVPQDHIRFMYDEDATLDNMKSALGIWLRKNARKNDTVYIYFAGHGAPDPDSGSSDGDGFEKYLLPTNADPSALYVTALPMKEVAEIFGRINSDRVVFIADSCFSGATGGRTMFAANSTRAALSEQFWERLSRGKGRVILSASRANEVSVEDVKYGGGHGVFTYYLLEGLKGAADYSKDGFVDVDEVYRYISEKVPEATEQRQTPMKKGEVEGTLVVGKVK